jgi:hypothetical protein
MCTANIYIIAYIRFWTEGCGKKNWYSHIGENTMKEYSFTEARQQFASVLEEAKKDGVICIRKRDGESFYLKPATPKKSPLDIQGVDIGITSTEIVDIIRSGRERNYS